MEVTKIRGATGQQVYDRIESELGKYGFRIGLGGSVNVRPTYVSFTVELADDAGRNVHIGYNYTERKINKLGWDDWVFVNGMINRVLDDMQVSANVQSLKGQFVIRRGTQKFVEDDWADQRHRNVGSIMEPVSLFKQNQPSEERIWPLDYARGVRVKAHKRRVRKPRPAGGGLHYTGQFDEET